MILLTRITRRVALASLIFFLFLLVILTDSGKTHETRPAMATLENTYPRFPLYFIQNKGELDNSVRFYERGGGHAFFFTREGVYLLLEKAKVEAEEGITPTPPSPLEGEGKGGGAEIIKLSFLDANKNPEIIGEGLQEGRVNYFLGHDPAQWKTNIPTYKAIVYKEIYPGIDMKFYGNNRQLEYDLIVKPGADLTSVRFSYEGIEDLRTAEDGNLEIGLPPTPPSPAGGEGKRGGGKIFQKKPYIYQEIDGRRTRIEGKFKVQSNDVILSGAKDLGFKDEILRLMPQNDKGKRPRNNRIQLFSYGFNIASYDKRYPLIIDPVLVYSTYLGGRDIEQGFGIAVDPDGNAYVTGATLSFTFPTADPMQRALAGDYDIFIAKINPAGSGLVYSTYLGGMTADYGYAITVDPSGNIYVTGLASSFNFPTKKPLQAALAGDHDAFLAKLDPQGKLIYSTYLGGSRKDEGRGIATDSLGNVYITGLTDSDNFPTKKPFQRSFSGGSGSDAFIAKINPTGSALVYSTYLGGTAVDQGFGIAVDTKGNAYVTGDTQSANFPVSDNAFQQKFDVGGNTDAFIAKFDTAGSLIYSTFLGGRGHDNGYAIAVDSSGNAYVTGRTASNSFPVANPMQKELKGGEDIFIAKINPTGSALVYSTYLGGRGLERGSSIAIDSKGNAYITGRTSSSDFPVLKPFQRISGRGIDAFIAKVSPSGSALVYSSYLGGNKEDQGSGIAIDSSGNAYITGRTNSRNFPTARSLQRTSGGFGDAFIAKIADTPLK